MNFDIFKIENFSDVNIRKTNEADFRMEMIFALELEKLLEYKTKLSTSKKIAGAVTSSVIKVRTRISVGMLEHLFNSLHSKMTTKL